MVQYPDFTSEFVVVLIKITTFQRCTCEIFRLQTTLSKLIYPYSDVSAYYLQIYVKLTSIHYHFNAITKLQYNVIIPLGKQEMHYILWLLFICSDKNCYKNICNRISKIQTAMQARFHMHYLFCRFSFHLSSLSLRSYLSIDPYPQIFELEFVSKNSKRSSPQYFHRVFFFILNFSDTSDDTSTRIVTLLSRYIAPTSERVGGERERTIAQWHAWILCKLSEGESVSRSLTRETNSHNIAS